MIYAKTKLKKIPDTCTKCKFKRYIWHHLYNVKGASKWTCGLTNSEVPYAYVKEKHNWVYGKCRNCPLVESSIENI